MSDDEEYAKLLEGTILEVPKAKRPRKSAEPAPEPELVGLQSSRLRLFKHGGRLPFNVVAALLELGHKYNIEVIRQEALSRMKTCFCHSFATFRASVTFGTVVRGSEGHRYAEMALFTPVLEVIPTQDAIRAVNVIRLVKQTSMLPMALYLCTMVPAATLATGVMRPDGGYDTLSQEDLIRCIDARTTLAMRTCRKRETIWYSRWWRGVDAMCGSSRACREAVAVKMKAEREARTIFPTAHPLASLAPEIRTLSLCAACLEAMLAAEVEETRFVWEKLPADLHLDVPEWNATLTK
ncbi:hypothetical protein ONZ51_g9272 [Trametes cubensis]|uniref:Uncharacterized protein n=1 Tax=Trametes cubensis TaxID=1111947 RepID=A0AAD7TM48_9APHY|nr:hypothetical protein ONZ51_g9272 [Trametes cubensis]